MSLARIRRLPPPPKEKPIKALIWIDPARRSGDACIYGHRLTVDMVASYVWSDMVHDLEFGYDLTKQEILGACWYLVRYGAGLYSSGREKWVKAARKAWRQWADDNETEFWYSRYDGIPYPPSEAELASLKEGEA